MYDAEHVESTPRDFTLTVAAISQSWTEGTGLDTVNYTDLGVSNWISASQGTAWAVQGGDFLTGSGDSLMFTSQDFPLGTENLDVDDTIYTNASLTTTLAAGTYYQDASSASTTHCSQSGYLMSMTVNSSGVITNILCGQP